ncbi:MAG: hypothetical protein K2G38_00965 [Clostridia bacterium]|nr:hypothetical protein [Clostridia bacterium]
MFSENINKIYDGLASIKFDTLIWIVWGSFLGIFALTFILGFVLPKIREASKRPFLCFVNIYAALTVAAFLTANGFGQSVLAAAIFWCVGYLLYGVLCFFTKRKQVKLVQSQVAVSSLPITPPPTTTAQKPQTPARAEIPAAKSSVRLEHAISVTDRLLQKNLGKGDRQELEKLKNTLAVLQMKGTLTPAEADILNENFNALLKLMAKYNV